MFRALLRTIVVVGAQWLPITFIPEQLFVATVGHHVIYMSGQHDPTLPSAEDAVGLSAQEPEPGLLPSTIIQPAYTLCHPGGRVGFHIKTPYSVLCRASTPRTHSQFFGCGGLRPYAIARPGGRVLRATRAHPQTPTRTRVETYLKTPMISRKRHQISSQYPPLDLPSASRYVPVQCNEGGSKCRT